MNYKDEEQIELQYVKENEEECHDEFAENIKPLEELLDSVRNMDGFPIGEDEDILGLSDPPYYTACPNPYINGYIDKYGKPYEPDTDEYQRTPFVGDVSEGKNDPIYNAHAYHTKVPHKAIMKFIEHYTEEGDIVFDGFCGSGMTGVAAQLLNRRAILSDLSPAATFIAYNYNTPVDAEAFQKEAKRILNEVEKECGWMYETMHTDGVKKGIINYILWSDVVMCRYCNNEIIYWNTAVDATVGKIKEKFQCKECNATISKKECLRATITYYDNAVGNDVTQPKQYPVLISYSVGETRYKKTPDDLDIKTLELIEKASIPYWHPTNLFLNKGSKWGDTWRAGVHFGITHTHHFFTKRNLWTLSKIFDKIKKANQLFLFTSLLTRSSKQARFLAKNYFQGGGGWVGTSLSGTLYIPSLNIEVNPYFTYNNRISKIFKKSTKNKLCLVSTQSTTRLSNIKNQVIDYIITDPPFGDNLMYSELNFVWESWLKITTSNKAEAIVSKSQKKEIAEYKRLMTHCFEEMYRILKPNRWITVIFHNSKASVWNAIQDAITKAGFVIAQVTIMDKKQGSFKQVTSAGSVKNDLIISAYKPKIEFSERFLISAGEGMEKDFLFEHLAKLPLEPNIERTEQMLYSKLLAHYVQRGFAVSFNARQFYKLLRDNFYLIDGFWFREDQVIPYEEWKKAYGLSKIEDLKSGQQVLIGDEKSALTWLYQYLEEPKTFSDIYTAFHKIATQTDDLMPEPKVLLDNNFIFENNSYRRPYSELEQETVEMQREKELHRAFESLLTEAQTSKKRLKSVRKEALKYGFTKAYQEKRFADILRVANKLDNKIMEENSDINDFVEVARIKMGEG